MPRNSNGAREQIEVGMTLDYWVRCMGVTMLAIDWGILKGAVTEN